MAYFNKSRVMIKATRALQTLDQVKSHTNYVGYGSKQLGEQERGAFFSKDKDKASHSAFIQRVAENPALQHSLSIKVQKLVFSLREEDYRAYCRSGRDYKDIVRATLEKYEKKHNVKLDWIANIHAENDASSHPHAHVIIKGVSDSKGDRGFTRIRFDKEDFNMMRDDFDNELENHAEYTMMERIDMDKVMKDMGSSFEQMTAAFEAEIKKEQMKAEVERNATKRDKGRGR